MDLMHFVLGYENNTVIAKYREKQFEKLLEIFGSCNIDTEKKSQFLDLPIIDQKKFLTSPDQASIILCLGFYEDTTPYIDRLEKELDFYLAGEFDAMIMYSGHTIPGTDVRLTLEDNNPLNGYDAHPDSESNEGGKLGWGTQSPEDWIKVYENTFQLLKDIDPEFFAELNHMIQKIVPFGTAKHVHYSASYRECVGTLYMGYTLDTDIPELHVLEGLVHESSHNKLNIALQEEEITLNDYSEKYYSPYRPDARHLYGVFLGIHALIPTVYVLLNGVDKGYITDKRWLEKIALYHMKNKIGISVVKKYGILSELGMEVFDQLQKVARDCDPLLKTMITRYSVHMPEIQKKAKEHFKKVNEDYPHLQY